MSHRLYRISPGMVKRREMMKAPGDPHIGRETRRKSPANAGLFGMARPHGQYQIHAQVGQLTSLRGAAEGVSPFETDAENAKSPDVSPGSSGTSRRRECSDLRYAPMLESTSSSCSSCSGNPAAEPWSASSSASLDG